ncbi:MAG: M24 family metallopeptidase, partial [Pseudomonadota bacterium]
MDTASEAPRGRLTREGIRLYEPGDFAGMAEAGRVAATILDEIAPMVVPGQSTAEIDRVITEKVVAAGAKSATIGYKGYQHASCISVNHVVCHGIPGAKTLKDVDVQDIPVLE